MKKLYLTIALAFSLSTIEVNADIVLTDAAVPKMLHVYNEAGYTYVDLLQGYCSTSRFLLLPSHEKYDSIFSILLAAQMAQKPVRIRFDGCVNNSSQGNIIGVFLP